MPTRARPTIGLAFGSMHTIGSTVKPMARRSGTDDLQPVADRRRVPLSQDVEVGLGEGAFGHDVFLS